MIAAADIGGHTLTVGTAENGAVLRKRTVATPPERTPHAVCAAARAILDGLGVPAETPLALGVPGFVIDGERVSGCPNLSGWEGVTAGELGDLCGHAVTLANDCDLFALGEMSAGAAKDLDDFVFITLGTGVGGSVIVNRRLVRGAHGRTGEIGHFALLDDRGCGCGGRGHLESFFSANAFERAAKKFHMEPDMPALWERRENAWLARPFAEGTRALACVLTSLTCLLDPQAIVIGGGLSHLDGLCDDLRDYMFPLLPRAYRPGPELRLAQLETDAPLLGAEELLTGKNRPHGR
jgi:glucokinase